MTLYTETNNNQDTPTIISSNNDVSKGGVCNPDACKEGEPFLTETNSDNVTHLNITRVASNTNGNNQRVTVYRQDQQDTHTGLSRSNNEPLIFQDNPYPTSGIGNELMRSFTFSLQSYELAAKKRYILLMRNFDYSKQYPDYHAVINFLKRMPIENFSKKRRIAFEYLKRWGTRGYYVHAPTLSRNFLHVHMLAIYGGSKEDLQTCIKLAFTIAGLTYGKDFRVKVFPVGATDKDFKRLCSYVLKFNGKRKTNRYTPVLFSRNLGLHKTGSFGKWFVKPQRNIWNKYRAQLRLKHNRKAWLDFCLRIPSGKYRESYERMWTRYIEEVGKLIRKIGRRPLEWEECCEVFTQINQDTIHDTRYSIEKGRIRLFY